VNRVLQIVPYLPPAISGVGDYALILARGLRDKHGWHTTFISSNPNDGQTEIEGFPVIPLKRRTADQLAGVLVGHERVLLQYVGYGFQKRGCPLWLLQGLRRWNQEDERRRLVTMFHELYASGPPWRSSFWTHPVQRWICGQLARLSDECVTNVKGRRTTLERIRRERSVKDLAVFSNVGESTKFRPLVDRKARLVIFGGGPRFASVLQNCLKELREFLINNGIESIAVVGRMVESLSSLPIPVEQCNTMDAKEIHEILENSRVGLMNYSTGCLGKSGVFASYCAHGLAPVLLNPNSAEKDGLFQGSQYAQLKYAVHYQASRLDTVAEAAWKWYQGHSVERSIATYHSLLF